MGRHFASAAAVQNWLQTSSELDLGVGSDIWQRCSSGQGGTPSAAEEGEGQQRGGGGEGKGRGRGRGKGGH